MADSGLDKDDSHDDAMFDFLHDGSERNARRPGEVASRERAPKGADGQPSHAGSTSDSASGSPPRRAIPVVREPVPVSVSGALRAPVPGQPFDLAPAYETDGRRVAGDARPRVADLQRTEARAERTEARADPESGPAAPPVVAVPSIDDRARHGEDQGDDEFEDEDDLDATLVLPPPDSFDLAPFDEMPAEAPPPSPPPRRPSASVTVLPMRPVKSGGAAGDGIRNDARRRREASPAVRRPVAGTDDDWRVGTQFDGHDREVAPRGAWRLPVALLGVSLLAGGIGLFAWQALESGAPGADAVDVANDDASESVTPSSPAAAGSEYPTGRSGLADRFRVSLAEVETAVNEGRLDEAGQAIVGLDRSVYGYGASEFKALEERIARLREDPDAEADEAAKVAEAAEAAKAAEADRVAEAARAEAADAAEADKVAEAEKAVEAARIAAREAAERRVAQEEAARQQAAADEAAEREEAARSEAEKAEAERVEAERVEAERVEAERVEAERVEAERAEAERVQAERARRDREEAERLAERQRQAERDATDRQIAAERARVDGLENAERRARDRAEAVARVEAERAADLETSNARAREIASRRAARRAEEQAAAEAENRLASAPLTESPASRPITDEDLQIVYRRFSLLEQAIESRNIDEVVALTRPSGPRVQQFLQMFQNSSRIDARITGVETRNASASITGQLRIDGLTRDDGVSVQPPQDVSSITLTSNRSGNEWSTIEW